MGERFLNPVTLVNTSLQGNKLLYVNQSFFEMTKYSTQESLGQNCKFLQGKETDLEAVQRIRTAIAKKLPICQDLINYRKTGDVFFNRLVLIPFKEGSDQFFIGFQHEISSEIFCPSHTVGESELLDKTINPLAIMMGLTEYPDENFEEDMFSTAMRIKDYVLKLR